MDNRKKFAINVDMETLNEFGRNGRRACHEESHNSFKKHYDITIHKESCKHFKSNRKAVRAYRYWIKDINSLEVAMDIAFTQQRLWNGCYNDFCVLVRKCRVCLGSNV